MSKPVIFLLISILLSCCPFQFTVGNENPYKNNQPVEIELVTNFGTIILRLSDATPLHRDNFIKLVESKTYDSLLFHRVIEEFMIQAGDVKSKYADSVAALGSADLPYQVPAEIVPNLFHKKELWAQPELTIRSVHQAVPNSILCRVKSKMTASSPTMKVESIKCWPDIMESMTRQINHLQILFSLP